VVVDAFGEIDLNFFSLFSFWAFWCRLSFSPSYKTVVCSCKKPDIVRRSYGNGNENRVGEMDGWN